ncbi:MAG: HDOD domain-containing protein [Desulfobacterales bacterium]|jgi:putative nucleotidyltransferase with HDIG domain
MAKFSITTSETQSHELLLELARTLAAITEEMEPLLKGHSERVANNCANFCEAFKLLPDPDIFKLYLAGLVHDIGLIFFPKTLLKDDQNRSDDEKIQMRKHPVIAEKILSNLSILKQILPLIRHHHEAFDGSGYPDGLTGDEIPLGARILVLFNELDTLIFPFSKRAALNLEEAIAAIRKSADKQFDSKLIDQFVQFVESNSGESEDFILKKERASIREIFTNIIQDFTAGKIRPPVMPQVVRDVQSVIKQPNSSAEDVAAVIERDPVISLRLISVANSPVYRGIQEIPNIREAIPRMGLKETLNVVIAIVNKSLYETDRAQFKILMDKLWVHSLASAYGSKLIAEHLKLEDSEKFFLMGLVHDIGKCLLLKAFTDITEIKNINFDVIQTNIQQGHLSIGGVMLRRWGFDDLFLKVVTLHEGHELTPETEKEILVVHLANMLMRTIGYSLFEDDVNFNELDSAKFLEIEPASLSEIGKEIKSIIQDVAHLF